MVMPQLLWRASLFALLIMHVCGVPVKSGYNPQAYGSSFSKGAPPADELTPELEETPEVEFMPEVVEAPEVEESPDVEVSYSLPPPDPVYQAGELSQYRNTFEFGDYQRETEEEGSVPPPPPPPPPPVAAAAAPEPEAQNTSPPRPVPGPPGFRGYFPYFDYNFLYGNYPVGTYTHSSSSFEQGRDYWKDAHYVRYPVYEPAAAEEPEPPQYPEPAVDYAAPDVHVTAPSKQPADVKNPGQIGY